MLILLRSDFTAVQMLAAAWETEVGPHVKHLLAFATIYDGGTRGEAAKGGEELCRSCGTGF